MDILSQLAKKHDTDKGIHHHGYTPIYHKYLSEYRNSDITFLEIGFGGYEYFDRGGGSAKMWREYFSKNSRIIITDIYDKYHINGIEFYNTNKSFLPETNFDVIIDDGSHINIDIIHSFIELFPTLKSGGIYIVEDLETSYWPDHGYNGHKDPSQTEIQTAMRYFTELSHQLNHVSFESKYHHDFAKQLDFIHFYKNLVIIKKK